MPASAITYTLFVDDCPIWKADSKSEAWALAAPYIADKRGVHIVVSKHESQVADWRYDHALSSWQE